MEQLAQVRPMVLWGILALAMAGCAVPVGNTAPTIEKPDRTAQAAPANTGRTISSNERAIARAFINVVETLEPVAERECRQRAPRLDCDFRIVLDDRPQPPNAYQTVDDNGRPIIAFTLSLLAEMRNADEIAFVMAHEAAHHIEDHLSQQRRNATVGAEVFGRLAGVTGGGEAAIRTAQELGAAVGARSYSKDFELEADRLGTIISARAGYDPVRGAEFFFRVPDPGDQFLGTHPPNAERVQMVRNTAAQL